MSDELKCCPFCGGSDLLICEGHHNFVDAKVTCQDCATDGPFIDESKSASENRAAAIAAWNKRTPPAVSAETTPIEAALRDAVAHGSGMVRVHSDSSIDYIPESAWRKPPPTSEQARDAERYRHILDCEVLAARTYVPDLDEADFKAKRRAANDRESAAMKAKP